MGCKSYLNTVYFEKTKVTYWYFFGGGGVGPVRKHLWICTYVNHIKHINFNFLLVFRLREDRIKSLQYYEYIPTTPNYLADAFKHFFKVSHETLTIDTLCEFLS